MDILNFETSALIDPKNQQVLLFIALAAVTGRVAGITAEYGTKAVIQLFGKAGRYAIGKVKSRVAQN